MADKFIYDNAGVLTEKTSIITSAGAGDSGKIVALDANGLIALNMMPIGIGAENDSIVSSENLAAGDFVNIWNSTGLKVRKADASIAGKEAHGFVLAAVTAPAAAVVYRASQSNNQKTAMTVAAKQYLSVTVPGGTQETAPTVAGQVVQLLGVALTATTMAFNPETPWVKA